MFLGLTYLYNDFLNLKIIIKNICEVFLINLRNKVINPSNKFYRELVERLRIERTNLVDQSNNLDFGTTEIIFSDDLKLSFPNVMLKMKGHDLEDHYRNIFPSLLPIHGMLDFIDLNEM